MRAALLLIPGLVWGAGALERVGEEVHRDRPDTTSSTPATPAQNGSGFGARAEDNYFDLVDVTSVVSTELSSEVTSDTGPRHGHPDTMFADSEAPAARVPTPVFHDPLPEPLQEPWHWGVEVGCSAARHDSRLWRWGVDAGAGVRDGLGIDLRFDGYREDVGSDTVLVNILLVGLHYRLDLGDDLAPVCLGMDWVSWHDAIGSEGGLAAAALWSPRWDWIAVDLEARAGFINDSGYQRYAAAVGPALGPVAVQIGYEAVIVAGVDLGGPQVRIQAIW